MTGNLLTRRTFTLAALAVCLVAGTAWSGEFYEKDGAALTGHDAVAYFNDGKSVKGSAEHKASYKGSTFYFANEANRAAFSASPERYAPQYGGYCAFGTASGYKAKIDPAAFTIVAGKLYLNYDRAVQKQWSADIPGFIAKADAKWPEVAKQTSVYE